MKTQKAYRGPAMEGKVASWYARNTLKDLNRHKFMAEKMAPLVPENGSVLEVAPGPGYFCLELAKLGRFQISGLDISRSFVDIASENARRAGLTIDFRQGDAADMPFEANRFDLVFCQAAFKNFSRPVQAITEMHRVLKPGGKAVIADLRKDASREGIDAEVNAMGLSGLNRWFTRLTFDAMLLKTAYTITDIERMAAQTPFKTCRMEITGIGFTAWFEKQPN